MEKNQNIGLSKICSNNSILVVNKTGIYRLFTPFKALVIEQVECYSIGEEVLVIEVKMSKDFKLIYVIRNKAYFHHYFMILWRTGPTQTTFN